jgi:hypothetical protein
MNFSESFCMFFNKKKAPGDLHFIKLVKSGAEKEEERTKK